MSTRVKVLNIGNEVTLPQADNLRETLRKGIDSRNITIVDVSTIEDIDLSGIQLLYAARRYAEGKNREFHLTGTLSEGVARTFFRSGFVTEQVSDGKTLEDRLHEFNREENTNA
jgi:anti-anti-sigma regulatory factor